MDFKVIETKIKDVKIFQPEKFEDSRGYLIESYRKNFYEKYLPNVNFVQDNESKSLYGVIRGLHYQVAPFEQSKLIRVNFGKIQDVIIDLRRESSTYGSWESYDISSENNRVLFVPKGFAHGFLVLSNKAIVTYKVDNYYNKNFELGINYNDSDLDIAWSLDSQDIIINDKDLNYPSFRDLK